jgi:hypothetical protein
MCGRAAPRRARQAGLLLLLAWRDAHMAVSLQVGLLLLVGVAQVLAVTGFFKGVRSGHKVSV